MSTLPAEAQPTPRQLQVIAGIARGHTNAEIGRRLGLTANTVKTHVRMIHIRLQAANRAHIVHTAYRLGYLSHLRPESRRDADLLPIQKALVARIADGMSNAQIAQLQGVHVGVVKAHVSLLLTALGARTRAHAVAIAWQQGLLGSNTGAEAA